MKEWPSIKTEAGDYFFTKMYNRFIRSGFFFLRRRLQI